MTDFPSSNTRSYDFMKKRDDGLWVSRILTTALQLEVFTKLSGKSVTLTRVQKFLEMESCHTESLCTSLVVLGLLNVSSNKGNEHRLIYSNSEISDEFLDKGKPSNYIGELITMLDKQECNTEGNSIESLKTNLTLEESDEAI
jgi:hypothetical protein